MDKKTRMTAQVIARLRRVYCPLSMRFRRQRSEQWRTLSQSRAHFRRQVNARPQVAQSLVGNLAFGFCRAIIDRSSFATPASGYRGDGAFYCHAL